MPTTPAGTPRAMLQFMLRTSEVIVMRALWERTERSRRAVEIRITWKCRSLSGQKINLVATERKTGVDIRKAAASGDARRA